MGPTTDWNPYAAAQYSNYLASASNLTSALTAGSGFVSPPITYPPSVNDSTSTGSIPTQTSNIQTPSSDPTSQLEKNSFNHLNNEQNKHDGVSSLHRLSGATSELALSDRLSELRQGLAQGSSFTHSSSSNNLPANHHPGYSAAHLLATASSHHPYYGTSSGHSAAAAAAAAAAYLNINGPTSVMGSSILYPQFSHSHHTHLLSEVSHSRNVHSSCSEELCPPSHASSSSSTQRVQTPDDDSMNEDDNSNSSVNHSSQNSKQQILSSTSNTFHRKGHSNGLVNNNSTNSSSSDAGLWRPY